jgi:hypothetical protein
MMPPQNPLTRIEQVASDLERLADELGEYAGVDARTTLMCWQAELLEAVDEILRLGTSPVLSEHARAKCNCATRTAP